VIEIENEPADHAGAVDLHVRVTNRVLAWTHPGGGLIVTAPRQIWGFLQYAIERRTVLEVTASAINLAVYCVLLHGPPSRTVRMGERMLAGRGKDTYNKRIQDVYLLYLIQFTRQSELIFVLTTARSFMQSPLAKVGFLLCVSTIYSDQTPINVCLLVP